MFHNIRYIEWLSLIHIYSSGGAYGKITFRLAGAPMAWYGGKHRLEQSATVRDKMLNIVRRINTVFVEQ